MVYQLNPFQPASAFDWDSFFLCGTCLGRPYECFQYYRIASLAYQPWLSTALYYPAAVAAGGALFMPGPTTDNRRRFPWPGQIKFCAVSGSSVGGVLASYYNISIATELIDPGTLWSFFAGSISGPACVTSPVIPLYEFSNNPNATVADYSWPGRSNLKL